MFGKGGESGIWFKNVILFHKPYATLSLSFFFEHTRNLHGSNFRTVISGLEQNFKCVFQCFLQMLGEETTHFFDFLQHGKL